MGRAVLRDACENSINVITVKIYLVVCLEGEEIGAIKSNGVEVLRVVDGRVISPELYAYNGLIKTSYKEDSGVILCAECAGELKDAVRDNALRESQDIFFRRIDAVQQSVRLIKLIKFLNNHSLTLKTLQQTMFGL